MKLHIVKLSGFCIAFALSSCVTKQEQASKDASKSEEKTTEFATAELSPASGSKVKGTVTFSRQGDDLLVVANVQNVTPAGLHGLHIHEKGDCSARDASSAGGHFNPLKKKHGAPNATESHVGDFGNIEVDSKGKGELRLTIDNGHHHLEKLGGWKAITGKAVILHSGRDDLKSQPSGDAASRIGCGIIKAI